MDTPKTESKSKFQQLVEQYEAYLAEAGFPPIAPINTPQNTGGSTNTPATSAVNQAMDTDPAVVAAKKKAADAISLELKKKAGTITNP